MFLEIAALGEIHSKNSVCRIWSGSWIKAGERALLLQLSMEELAQHLGSFGDLQAEMGLSFNFNG